MYGWPVSRRRVDTESLRVGALFGIYSDTERIRVGSICGELQIRINNNGILWNVDILKSDATYHADAVITLPEINLIPISPELAKLYSFRTYETVLELEPNLSDIHKDTLPVSSNQVWIQLPSTTQKNEDEAFGVILFRTPLNLLD
jgi:hypothetical protein